MPTPRRSAPTDDDDDDDDADEGSWQFRFRSLFAWQIREQWAFIALETLRIVEDFFSSLVFALRLTDFLPTSKMCRSKARARRLYFLQVCYQASFVSSGRGFTDFSYKHI